MCDLFGFTNATKRTKFLNFVLSITFVYVIPMRKQWFASAM